MYRLRTFSSFYTLVFSIDRSLRLTSWVMLHLHVQNTRKWRPGTTEY